MSALEALYKKSVQPPKERLSDDVIYLRMNNQIQQYCRNLHNRLPERDGVTLDKLLACYDEKTRIENARCFKDGLREGLAVVVKSLE